MEKLLEAIKAKLGEDVISEELIADLRSEFEVMVNEKVQELIITKEKELEEDSAKEMTEFKDSLIESLDKYIEYATDEYLKENEVALEAKTKVEAATKIIEAAKGVFAEIGLEIPESEIDRVKELEEEIKEVNEKLNNSIEEIIEAKKQNFEYEKAISFQKLTTDLAESKIEEVHTLLEGLEYSDIEDFERKVKIVMGKIKDIKEEEEEENLDLDDLKEQKKSSIDKYLV